MLNTYRMDSEAAKLMRRRYGAYIKGLRTDAGLTQAQIAKALGYEYYTMISQIEVGKARIPSEDIGTWASLLQVDKVEFAKNLLKYLDPFMFHALFGGEHPLTIAKRELNARHKRSSSSTADAR